MRFAVTLALTAIIGSISMSVRRKKTVCRAVVSTS